MAVLSSAVVACPEVPVAEAPVEYRLLTEQVWSGGQLEVQSAAFRETGSEVLLVIDGDTLSPVSRSEDTLGFQLDVLGSGVYPLTLLPHLVPAADSPDHVVIHGFAGCYPGPVMGGFPLPWPEAYQLSTFVAYGVESAIIVDAASGLSEPAVPPSAGTNSGEGFGPGWAPGRSSVVLSSQLTGACLWHLRPPVPTDTCATPSRYTIALLTGGTWLRADKRNTTRFADDKWEELPLGEPDGLAVAPGGRYAVVSGYSAEGQLLVPADLAQPMARIPAIRSSEAPAAFSVDGDTVFLVGGNDSTTVLVALDPARPALPIAEVTLGNEYFEDIAFDPAAPYLYLLHGSSNVWVMDRSTLAHVATLRHDDCGSGIVSRLRLARNFGRLFVISTPTYEKPSPNSNPLIDPRAWILAFDLVLPSP